uniref:NADH dehydrogenase subunit 2 n=1 Tax=Allonothrus sinicus TaxID=3138099 RepID=UPI00315D68F9
MTILPIMASSLIFSTMLCFISNSWMILWVALEINTLSFCTVMMNQTTETSKTNKEPAMKYFIVQSVASAILVMYLSVQKYSVITNVLFMAGVVALLIKMAASPFHSWFTEVLKKMTWLDSTVLMTWQKLAPLYLLTFIIKPLVTFFIILTTLVGSTTQLLSKSTMEIMALSSVFNLGWMMLAAMVSLKTMVMFTLMYWSSVLITMLFLKSLNVKEINKNMSKSMDNWVMMLAMANLAGIPPSIGFLAKWNTAIQALMNSMTLLVTMMMIISAINFYIYLRLTLTINSSSFAAKQKNMKFSNPKLIKTMLMVNIPALAMVPM